MENRYKQSNSEKYRVFEGGYELDTRSILSPSDGGIMPPPTAPVSFSSCFSALEAVIDALMGVGDTIPVWSSSSSSSRS